MVFGVEQVPYRTRKQGKVKLVGGGADNDSPLTVPSPGYRQILDVGEFSLNTTSPKKNLKRSTAAESLQRV